MLAPPLQNGLPLHHRFGAELGESFLLKLFFCYCLSKHELHQSRHLNVLTKLVGLVVFSKLPNECEYMHLQAPTQVLGYDALMSNLHLRRVVRIPQHPLRF